jgi:hypothetical protein
MVATCRKCVAKLNSGSENAAKLNAGSEKMRTPPRLAFARGYF